MEYTRCFCHATSCYCTWLSIDERSSSSRSERCSEGDVHCSQNCSDGSAKTSVYAPPCCTRNGKCATAAATITSMAYAAASTSGASCPRIYGGSAAERIRRPDGDATSQGFSPRPHFVGTCRGNECPSALSAAVMKMLEASVAILPRDDAFRRKRSATSNVMCSCAAQQCHLKGSLE